MNLRIKKTSVLSKTDISLWQQLWEKSSQGHFFNSPSYLLAFLYAFPVKYQVFFCYQKDRLVGVLPLVETRKYGIRTWAFPDRARGFLDKGSLLLEKNDPDIFKQIIFQIGKERSLFLKGLVEENFRTGSEFREKISKGFFEFEVICPRASLCQDPLAQMKTKQRREVRRGLRKYGKDLKFEFFEKAEPWQLEEMQRIECLSHKDKKGTALFDDSDAREIYASFFKICRDDCAVAFLSLNGKRVAHAFGFSYKKTFLCTHMAFDQEHSDIAPGKVLIFLFLERLCKEGFKVFDFSKGESFFKRQFMNQFPPQYNFYFSSNPFVLSWWKTMKRARIVLRKIKASFRAS